MKNVIRIIAGVQIILAAAFAFYASKIDPGVAKVSSKFAESCSKAADIAELHKQTYVKSTENVLRLRYTLKDTEQKTADTAEQLKKSANWLKKKPEGKIKVWMWEKAKFYEAGKWVSELSNSVKNVSISLHEQANILNDYEMNVMPKTKEGFDSTISSFRETSKFLKTLQKETRSNVSILSAIAGIIFFLNGITLLVIAHALPTARKEEC